MKELTDPAKIKAAETYNATSDFFDDGALTFWNKYGSSTITRLNLAPGSRVLDTACGTGASALAAARQVHPEGKVIAVDLAENLLKLGRSKAMAQGLENIEFIQGDMTDLGFPDESFDAVVCVFGVFFVPDMESLVRELWRMVRPKGKLAITTWGPEFFSPVYQVWREEIKALRPDLYSAFNPWDRITEVDAVRRLFNLAGIRNVTVEPETGETLLETPEDWWLMVMGTGLRWVVDQMSEEHAGYIKKQNIDWVKLNQVKAIKTNVIYAVATKT